MWTITLPLKVVIPNGKTVSLNLNTYRNLHHYTNNAAKVEFKNRVQPLIDALTISKQDMIHLHYTFFKKDKRRIDLMNATVVLDKFFSDVLTEAKIIEDDHCEIVVSTSFAFGGIDPANPRVEVSILPVTEPVIIKYN